MKMRETDRQTERVVVFFQSVLACVHSTRQQKEKKNLKCLRDATTTLSLSLPSFLFNQTNKRKEKHIAGFSFPKGKAANTKMKENISVIESPSLSLFHLLIFSLPRICPRPASPLARVFPIQQSWEFSAGRLTKLSFS